MIRPGEILYLLSIFLALWPAVGIAQTGSVRGSVVDQTGLVLPGATVILRGEGVPRTAYADEQGTFELAGVTPGTYTLTVSLAGFSDATVEDVVVSGTALALPPVELQLTSFGDTVVVTASRSEVRLLDAPVSTSAISASTLETDGFDGLALIWCRGAAAKSSLRSTATIRECPSRSHGSHRIRSTASFTARRVRLHFPSSGVSLPAACRYPPGHQGELTQASSTRSGTHCARATSRAVPNSQPASTGSRRSKRERGAG